jgi:hypothetical protein
LKALGSNVNFSMEAVIDRMREPLLQLLFSGPDTLSSAPLLSTRLLDRPIDLIITDALVHMPIRDAHERDVIAHVFLPYSFTALPRFISCAMGEIRTTFTPDFASTLLETFSFAKGFICHSIDKFDEHLVDVLRQRSLPCSNVPVRFVAPLMSEELDDKHNVRIFKKIRPHSFLFTIHLYIHLGGHYPTCQTMVGCTMGTRK